MLGSPITALAHPHATAGLVLARKYFITRLIVIISTQQSSGQRFDWRKRHGNCQGKVSDLDGIKRAFILEGTIASITFFRSSIGNRDVFLFGQRLLRGR